MNSVDSYCIEFSIRNEALLMVEVHMFFVGPLPPETVDETAVASEGRGMKIEDPLSGADHVKALIFSAKKQPNSKC